MFRSKYFEGVRKAQENGQPFAALPRFDLARLRGKAGVASRVKNLFLEDPRWWLAILRRFRPIASLGSFVILTRDIDVREVLERQDEFTTPYGPEMAELAGGANFILGMQDGKDYRRMKSAVLSAFPPQEVEQRVRPLAARHAQAILARADPGFDAIGELLKVVPVRLCRDYFGIAVDDDKEFAAWAMALSAMFFSDPGADPGVRQLARVAASRLTHVIDRSIKNVRAGAIPGDTPLGRLVAQLDEGRIALAEIHSVMLGMISGFAPTNLLAGGNCLDVILSKPEAQAAVRSAIANGDTKALDRAIRESMRFKPIWIGPWRYAENDVFVAQGTPRERLIRQGSTVIPSTLSAMFDPESVERPNEFDPERPDRIYMVYGHGIHVCIGAEVARVQIGECLRALFHKANLRRAAGADGRLKRLGAYPESLKLDFDREPLCRTIEQAMVTVVCPIRHDIPLGDIRAHLAALGNPAGDLVRKALDETGIIHFASIAVAPTQPREGSGGSETAMLVFDISGDGTADEVTDAFAIGLKAHLEPIVRAACGLAPAQSLRDFLAKHRIKISPSFGSNSGLVFAGTPGHSVRRIHAEAALADFVAAVVAEPREATKRDAAGRLAEARKRIATNGGYAWALQSAESRLEARQGSIWRAMAATLRAPAVLAMVVMVLAACWAITYTQVFGYTPGIFRNLLVAGTSLLLTVLGVGATALTVLGLLALALRRLEKRDTSSAASIEIDQLEAIIEREDWTRQNHLTAISVLKPGFLRRISLRLAFYLISVSARHVFRPGFLASINSIHFARWVLLPGTNRLMFFSNYGGSWESYLEDFITKASAGLTGVWSNTEDYPRTRWLFFDGATDGDRFKRWARRQQVPTLFWFSAYPDLNTQRIRTNSLIRRGLCTASDSEARDWLSLFGSRARPRVLRNAEPKHDEISAAPEQIESGEVQSIFFSAFGALEHGHMLAISVPEGLPRERRRQWLALLASRASFGDQVPRVRAMTVGFAADGLRRFGLEDGPDDDPLACFPVAFRHGMGNPARSRILDDTGPSRPELWRWGSANNPVDLAVFCYAADRNLLEDDLATLRREAEAAGLTIASELPLAVRRVGRRAIEHFGFVDGVSQPIVRGTARAHAGTASLHLVAPGEFLFGYRDEHGYHPISPTVRAAQDQPGILRPLRLGRGGDSADKLHDFGRNGSFLVVRQFEQHVEEFEAYCAFAASAKAREFGDEMVTPEWIAAKMLGRWKDGSSLVRNPEGRSGREPDNDFSFGAEDPQGLRCPLGAHIRRANPRDSLGDDHATQIAIGKRHRILRVGRTYELPATQDAPAEKGLLFMCLNADIERQYEFIQQTWVAAGSFHGLPGQKDPTIGANDGDGRFSIPFWEGSAVLENIPRFVTTRGGGYFFMPSRAALRYLLSRL